MTNSMISCIFFSRPVQFIFSPLSASQVGGYVCIFMREIGQETGGIGVTSNHDKPGCVGHSDSVGMKVVGESWFTKQQQGHNRNWLIMKSLCSLLLTHCLSVASISPILAQPHLTRYSKRESMCHLGRTRREKDKGGG